MGELQDARADVCLGCYVCMKSIYFTVDVGLKAACRVAAVPESCNATQITCHESVCSCDACATFERAGARPGVFYAGVYISLAV